MDWPLPPFLRMRERDLVPTARVRFQVDPIIDVKSAETIDQRNYGPVGAHLNQYGTTSIERSTPNLASISLVVTRPAR